MPCGDDENLPLIRPPLFVPSKSGAPPIRFLRPQIATAADRDPAEFARIEDAIAAMRAGEMVIVADATNSNQPPSLAQPAPARN